MKRVLSRHIGVLCLLLAAAAAVSFLLPLSVSAQPIFTGAVIIFLFYLGVSYIWAAASRKSEKS